MKASLLVFSISLLWCVESTAQNLIKYPSSDSNGNSVDVTAALSTPPKQGEGVQKLAAVVLFHSVAGWDYPVTEQYARALSEAGFLVLEPRLFANKAVPPGGPLVVLPMAYDALRYLASRDDVDRQRIGAAGFSFGGMVVLHAAASWAQAAYAKDAELKFAAHAPFYPICWIFSDLATGKRNPPGFPTDAFKKWTGVPIKIFAGGRDAYDDKDPNACAKFISYIPPEQQTNFSVQLYPEATHGWDQKSVTFYEKLACKGRGCNNSNEANPKVTNQSISDLVEYFRKVLSKTQR